MKTKTAWIELNNEGEMDLDLLYGTEKELNKFAYVNTIQNPTRGKYIKVKITPIGKVLKVKR